MQPLWPPEQRPGSGVGAQIADSSSPHQQQPQQPQPPYRQDGTFGSSSSQHPALDALADRATVLLQRLSEVERDLAVQEWWMLGKTIPDALVLAEVVSLLAVARSELENFLTDTCRRIVPARDTTGIGDQSEQLQAHMSNPRWVRANQEQARELLNMMATAIPPMTQYARALQSNAERLGMPSTAVDPLTIVMDRLNEALETLQQAPR